MNWADVVAMAAAHAENRGAKLLNYNQECWCGLIEFCRERKWRWRRYYNTINTTAAQPTYDLFDNTGGGLNQPELEELEAVYMVEGDGDLHLLPFITNNHDQAVALNSVTQDDPQACFRMPGDDGVLVVTPIPAGVVQLAVIGWLVPAFQESAPGDNNVPLVPGYLHPTLVKYLETRLLHFALGNTDSRFEAAEEELKEMMERATLGETGG